MNKIIITLIVMLVCHASFAEERWQITIDEKQQISLIDLHNNKTLARYYQYKVQKCDDEIYILVREFPKNWRVLNLASKTLLTGISDDILSVEINCAGVITNKNELLGFTPFEGKTIAPIYADIQFLEDLAIITLPTKSLYPANGIINTKGQTLVEPTSDYNKIYLSNDYIKVVKYGKDTSNQAREGILDLDGNIIIPPKDYHSIEWYPDEKIAVVSQLKNSIYDYGLVDAHQNILIPIKYRRIYYQDYIARIETHFIQGNNPKLGLYNLKTKKTLPPIYDSIEHFVNGIAVIYNNGKYGLIDENGEEIISPVYKTMFYDENQQFAEVTLNKKHGMIGPLGEIMVPAIFDRFTEYQPTRDKDGLVIGQNGDGYAVYNFRTGKVILPLKKYDLVMRTYSGFSYRIEGKTVDCYPDGTEIVK